MKNKENMRFWSIVVVMTTVIVMSIIAIDFNLTVEAETVQKTHNTNTVEVVVAEKIGVNAINLLLLTESYEQNLLEFVMSETGFSREESQFFIDTCERKNVDVFIAMAISYNESRFDPNVTGNSGEIGLFQLMSSTAKHYSDVLGYEFDVESTYDVTRNIDLATEHLKVLFDKYDDAHMALTAYNRGSGGLESYIYSGESVYEEPWMSSYSVKTLELAESFKEKFEKID